MRIWISANPNEQYFVNLYPLNKPLFSSTGEWYDYDMLNLCREHMETLVREIGVKLPKHNSPQLLEIELTPKLIAKSYPPRRKKEVHS